MAPANTDSRPLYAKDEKALCFHQELLYEAKILELRREDENDRSSPWEYRVHYRGWKNKWDDWVPQDRLKKWTEENLELKNHMMRAAREANQAARTKPGAKGKSGADSSVRGSEDRQIGTGRGTKRMRDNDVEKEASFLQKTSIQPLRLPEELKALLVDDWENVTKSQHLIPLPVSRPVNWIISEYQQVSLSRPDMTSSESSILEEFCAGVALYFAKCLPKILLYRQERGQLAEVRGLWEKPESKEWEGKGPGDVYGGDHLARLLVIMPELIAQTNMSSLAVGRLRGECERFAMWLGGRLDLFVARGEKGLVGEPEGE